MELEYRRDFEDVRRRWDAYWRGEDIGRPYIAIVTPKSGARPVKKPAWCRCLYETPDAVAGDLLAWAAGHEFLGEALPFFSPVLGPDHLAGLLGVELRSSPDSPETIWAVPFVDDWDDVEIAPRLDGALWARTVEVIAGLRKRCDGRVLITLPTLTGGLDALVAFRSSEKLMMDLIERPEKVQAARRAVDKAFDAILAALAAELDVPRYGSLTRHSTYCRGTSNVPQCDASCMMSPGMFREFGLPSVAHEAEALDSAIYHLDGPGAIRHLEAVCEVPRLAAIQWQPGAGAAAEQDWTDLYRRIDALGKGHILMANPQRVRELARILKSPRTFFLTNAPSRREGEELLRDLEKARR